MKKITSIILALSLFSFAGFTAFALDAENPSDVEDLTATSLDSAVHLKWTAATDDTGVEGYTVYYGLTSVTAEGQTYDFNKDVGDVLEYTVSDLENGTKYYFSVIAFDAAGNESIAWAPEVSATPSEDAGAAEDTDAPEVSSAEALNKEEVKVVFSEKVVLPEEDPQDAFSIENDDTFEALIVKDAKMDEEDEEGATMILTTDNQEEGVSYKLTVSIDIKDLADNPIISGTSDTAIFEGSGEEKVVASDLEIVNVEVVDNTHILVNFSKTIVLNIDPSENFVIGPEGTDNSELEVLEVVLGENSAGVENSSVIITTAPQEAILYTLTVVDLKDEDRNEISEEFSTEDFTGVVAAGGEDGEDNGAEEEDAIAPLDVANFIAEKVLEAEKYVVTLKWDIPEENKDDTVEQTIYKSENKGEKYDKETTLEPDVSEYEAGEFNPGEYWFKITQKDAAGNESRGSVVKVILSETGPGIVGLVLVSLGLGRFVARRKKSL